MQFCNTPDDVQWLKDTHLKVFDSAAIPEFKSFVILGSESSPYEIFLYESEDPFYSDRYMSIDTVNNVIQGWKVMHR